MAATIQTIALTTLAAVSLYDHREQVSTIASTINKSIKSAVKGVAKFTSSVFTKTTKHVYRKFNNVFDEYAYFGYE